MALGRKKGLRVSTRSRVTSSDMAIEERLASAGRGERNSIIYLGELVERNLKGEMGAILKALTTGRISSELQIARDNKISSDRILGRLEMAEELWQDFENFVNDKDKLIETEVSSGLENDGISVDLMNYHP